MGILKEGIIRVNLYLYCSNKYLVVLFWELRVIHNRFCVLWYLQMTLWLLIVCTRKPQAKSQLSQLEIWNISEEKVRFFGWCRLIKNLDHLTFILKTSSQRYIFVCSCELCMHATVLYNLTTCISIFLPKKSDEESLTPVTVWVVCDVETPKGRELLYSAIRQLVSLSDMVYFNLH